MAAAMKTPAPGAKRFFFIPSPDGLHWESAEATYRRRAWEVAYPGQKERDTMAELPPEGADWVEMVPPGREPETPWPHLPKMARAEGHAKQAKSSAPAPVRHVEEEAPRKPAAARAVPKKAIPGMSRELEDLMLREQKEQKAPEGMAKCPLCGIIIAPTRNKKVRTHDNPVKGARCEASNQPWAGFKERPKRPSRA
jgi:hypothetical protein